MKVTFLEAKVPLTKTFKLVDGQIDKDGHPKVTLYNSHHYEVSHTSLDEFYEKLKGHAELKHCWQKGNTKMPLKMASREGMSNPLEPTRTVCLDLDGAALADPAAAISKLSLGDPDYILQYSSSMGVLPGKGLSAHLIVLLDREMQPSELKEWIKHKNFVVPELAAGIRLSKNGNALRWTLDVTTCQSDKLIYIAPPVCIGVEDRFASLELGDRIQLVRGKNRTASLDTSGYNAETNSQRIQAKMDALRQEIGLKPAKWDRTRTLKGVEYQPNPSKATVTSVKEDGEKVRLNLNNGDSWGYWHFKANPKFLYNFKGEPTWLLSEIAPDYWASLRRESYSQKAEAGIVYLAFRDFDGSTYYNGTYDEKTELLEVAVAKSKEMVVDFLRHNGQPVPDPIPTWKRVYEPLNPKRFDLEAGWINVYQPSEFELRYKRQPERVAELPEVTRKWWLSAMAGDEECLRLFVNWAAGIVQLKEAMQTGWFFQGVQGTGKGLIFNEYLVPMLGLQNVVSKRITELTDQFTGFLDGRLLLWVDDTPDVDDVKAAQIIASFFRNLITEPHTSVRHMREVARIVKNYINVIVTSNKNGLTIDDPTDRRWNVAPWQGVQPPKPEPEEMERIKASAWPTYCYLMGYKVDRQQARTALDNEAKRSIIAKSRSSIDECCRALVEGNYTFFFTYVPDSVDGLLRGPEKDLAVSYAKIVKEMRSRAVLTRDELHTLFKWLLGRSCPPEVIKFVKFLSHHNIHIKPVAVGDTTVRGVKVEWKETT